MRAAEDRRWWILLLIAALLVLAWWFWPGSAPPAPQPEARAVERARPRAVRRAARPAPSVLLEPAQEQSPAPPPPSTEAMAPPLTPVPLEPTLTPEPVRYATLRIFVQDADGNPVRPAIISSEDCDFWRRAFDGQVSVRVEAKTCTVRAGRMDGPLITWSDDGTVDLSSGEDQELVLEVPIEKTAGIGMQIREHAEGIAIQWVMPGSPAQEAGLRPGDVVLEVDGEETFDMTVPEFIELGTGPAGSEVDLVVLRRAENGELEEEELTIVRQLLGEQAR